MPLGLFKGVRTFTLAPGHRRRDPVHHARGVHRARSCRMIWRSMPDLGPSFRQFATGLKQRAEQLTTRPGHAKGPVLGGPWSGKPYLGACGAAQQEEQAATGEQHDPGQQHRLAGAGAGEGQLAPRRWCWWPRPPRDGGGRGRTRPSAGCSELGGGVVFGGRCSRSLLGRRRTRTTPGRAVVLALLRLREHVLAVAGPSPRRCPSRWYPHGEDDLPGGAGPAGRSGR